MSRSLPPLNALKAFEAAARHESLTLAARELNVAHAAVSRHIRTLEAQLGIALFERTGRGVLLTSQGRELARNLKQAFDLIASATARFDRSPRRRQRLSLTCDVAFATHWLVPRLGDFISAYPTAEIVLDPSHRLVDFNKEDVDLGIRYGAGNWPNVATEKLADAHTTVVCHPRFLNARSITSPSDLKPETLMQEQDWQFWPQWFEAANTPNLVPSGPMLLHDLTLTAATAGQGFALADTIVSADAVTAGRLVRPFATTIAPYGYYLVSRLGKKPSKISSAFRSWLKAEIAKTELAVSGAFAASQAVRKTKPRR